MLVTVTRVIYNPPDELTHRTGDVLLHFVNYAVESPGGGSMNVMGESLRPGNVLDRLADALDSES